MGSMPILLADVTAWLTPIWLLSAGCFVGLAVLAILYGLLRLLAPRVAETVLGMAREGFLVPVLSLAAAGAAFALLSVVLQIANVGYLPLSDLTRSLERLPFSNKFTTVLNVAPVPKEERGGKPQEFELDYRAQEMRGVQLTSDKDLVVYLRDPATYFPGALVKRIVLNHDEPFRWSSEQDPTNPFIGRKATIYVLNPSDEPVKLSVSGVTREEYSQVAIVPYTAISLVGVVLGYVLLQLAIPKVMAVASTTAKEAMGQPLFQIVVILGGFALLVFIFVPYNTFGEDVKMLKMGALELITVLGILVAAWTASVSVSEEIEGRTALTVLSKPIGRIQFLLGKFFGVAQAVSLMYIFLGALLLITVSIKVAYDTRESSLPEALWTDCFAEMAGIVPGLVLAFFETMVLTSISVAISTRLPMLPNLLICFSVYALGNLAPLLVQAKVNDPYGIVRFVGQFFATVLPVLENFNIQAAVSAGVPVPLSYLAWALLYCVLYSTIAMLLALALFEDRDLA